MNTIRYTDKYGSFELDNPESSSYLYFPLVNEAGMMSCVTPNLAGDAKGSQNTFLLWPASSENLHNDKSTRNFWCSIKGKKAWSAAGVSAWQQAMLYDEAKEETKLSAGLLWHKMTRENHELGIRSEILSFVPAADDAVEIMQVTITNTGSEAFTFTPTAAIPMYCRSADNIRDHRHVTSLLHRIETSDCGVLVTPTLTFDERGHQLNQITYAVCAKAEDGELPVGFIPVTEEFIGEGGSFEWPEAIVKDHVELAAAGTKEEGYEAVGAIRFADTVLEPGASKSFQIALTIGEPEDKYLFKKNIEQLYTETCRFWQEKVTGIFTSRDHDFDEWMNWINIQPVLRRICGCSFLPHHDYGKGGRGWRDLWQDCLALILMEPKKVRGMLLNHFGGVRIDGSNATIIGTKEGEFIADRNNIVRVWMDHGVWPFITTRFYIEQTGDYGILLENRTYFKDIQAGRGESKDYEWTDVQGNMLRTKDGGIYEGTVLEHMLVQNLTAFYDVGEHNHMKLRGADWNDALDMAKEKGESVAFTAAYAGNLEGLADYLDILKKDKDIVTISMAEEIKILLDTETEIFDSPDKKQEILLEYCNVCRHVLSGHKELYDCGRLASRLREMASWIQNHIRGTEWVKNKEGYEWFNGYYDNHGRKVEGDFESGVRMMLTGQVFSIMSNTALTCQVKKITEAADQYLYDASIGGYRLNTNFHEIKTDMGRMFGFAYGHKENGAVFSHMAVMFAYSLYTRGFAKEGYKAIHALYSQSRDFAKSRIYPGIPEYFNQKGRGMYHYLTGAGSWMLLTVQTEMFGIKGRMGDLVLEPKLVAEQFDEDGTAGVDTVFADRKLCVRYVNKAGKEFGEYRIVSAQLGDTVYQGEYGGVRIPREHIAALDTGVSHNITVTLE